MEKLLALIVVLIMILGIAGIAVLAVRWARKSSKRAAFLGWGLQFLGAGVNPVPPPHAKIELGDKDAECGADVRGLKIEILGVEQAVHCYGGIRHGALPPLKVYRRANLTGVLQKAAV